MNLLYDDKWEAVESESDMGPGKPYCNIPWGLTGEVIVDGVVGIGLTGVCEGVGGGGSVDVGGKGAVGVGDALLSRGLLKTMALREAPAAADAAATMARVVFDMSVHSQANCKTRIEEGDCEGRRT